MNAGISTGNFDALRGRAADGLQPPPSRFGATESASIKTAGAIYAAMGVMLSIGSEKCFLPSALRTSTDQPFQMPPR
jgi:hypothetical protein